MRAGYLLASRVAACVGYRTGTRSGERGISMCDRSARRRAPYGSSAQTVSPRVDGRAGATARAQDFGNRRCRQRCRGCVQGASHGWRFGCGTRVPHSQLAARDLGRSDRRTRPSSGVLTFRCANGWTSGRLRRCDSVSETAIDAADLARQTASGSGQEEKGGAGTARTMTVRTKRGQFMQRRG